MTGARSISPGYGAILTAVLALATYLLALGNGFAFDDVPLIPRDARVIEGQLGQLLSTSYWKEPGLGLYRPLTTLSFGLDWFVGNGSPAWFHFTNIIWHMAASTLVYALLLRYFAIVPALLGAAIFAVHPVHVEAVANVVGRSELISTTFVLLACVSWPRITARLPRVVITAAFYFLAMCAKEGAAVLPALLVLIDFADGEWACTSISGYLRRRSWELAALTFTLLVFLGIRISVLGAMVPRRLDPSLEVLTTDWQRILTALQAWPLAVKVLLLPLTLLADYGPRILLPATGWNQLNVLGATIVVALLVGGAVALARGYRKTALGLLWYPIAILPVSNFIIPIGVLLAERTLYLPSVALSIAIAALFVLLSERAEPRLAAALAVTVVAAFSVRSMARVPEWHDTDRILLTLVRDRPEAFRGHWHAARAWRARGDVPRALAEYRRAMDLWPYREGVIQEIAVFASQHGDHELGRKAAEWGRQRWPGNVLFHRTAAANALDMADTAAAMNFLTHGLRLFPTDTIQRAMWSAAAPEGAKP